MRGVIATVVLCTAVTAVAQDLTIISKVTRDSEEPQTATSYISSDHLRISQPDGNEAIVDMKSGEMTVVDHRRKTYYVITQKDLDALAATIGEKMNSPQMKQAQEQMKNLPPEVQKRMQGMVGSTLTVEVEKSGSSRTVAGLRCENWTVNIGQMSRSEQCVTTDLKLPAASWDAYRNYMDRMRSMMAVMGPMSKTLDEMRQQFAKIKGFPIATKTTSSVMGRTSTTTNEVVEIQRGAIPESAWDIPAGYKLTESPLKQALRRAG
jgi:hypothetical protein